MPVDSWGAIKWKSKPKYIDNGSNKAPSTWISFP